MGVKVILSVGGMEGDGRKEGESERRGGGKEAREEWREV